MSVGVMYNLATRKNQNWGLPQYQAPKRYVDHIQIRKKRELRETKLKKVD